MLDPRVENFLTQDSSPGLVLGGGDWGETQGPQLLETSTVTGIKTGRREKSPGGHCYQTMSTKARERPAGRCSFGPGDSDF